jgi:PAS domain S-box-containing protein
MIGNGSPPGANQRFAAEFAARRGPIADQLSDLVSAHAPDGSFRYASAAAKELLGYEPDQLIGTSIYDYLHPDDVAKVAVAHRSALDGAPVPVAYRFRRNDSEYVWAETTSQAITEEGNGRVEEILCVTRLVEHRALVERMSSEEYRWSFNRLREVLDEQLIGPVYQPILDLDEERVVAYEALSRFPGDPARGPDRWFAEAWDVGLGIPLELLAVRIAAAAALPELPDDVGLCVNASPPTILSEGFLECFDGGTDRVTVELTEHLNVGDYAGFATGLGPLRRAGGKVAIDDFGAGYASLRHILKVRPEWIKLDISLTERIHENPVAHALANLLISFANEVGVRVVAEGIETEEELDALLELGFRYGQGFYFGVPAPLEEALAGPS